MRVPLQPAFVLHHRPYRETSLIVDLLTQQEGRIAVVARGVRTPRGSTRALLQAFTPLLVSWQGKTELMTLCSVEAQAAPMRLRGDCLLGALYLNELLMRLLQKQDPHPALYTLYQETLIALQYGALQQKIFRFFEKKLLEELGYGLQLQYDIHGNEIVPERFYRFYPEQGFEIISSVEDTCLVVDSPKEDTRIFLGKSVLALAHEALEEPEILREAKRLMRLALAPLLGQKPLQSRKLFIEVGIG